MNIDALRFGFEFLVSSGHPYVCTGFNSLCGYASVNHVRQSSRSRAEFSSDVLASFPRPLHAETIVHTNDRKKFVSELRQSSRMIRNVRHSILRRTAFSTTFPTPKRLPSKWNPSLIFRPLLGKLCRDWRNETDVNLSARSIGLFSIWLLKTSLIISCWWKVIVSPRLVPPSEFFSGFVNRTSVRSPDRLILPDRSSS